MEFSGFPLAEVFTAAGAVIAGGIVAGLVQLTKKFVPFLPDGGRAVLWVVGGLSAAVVALAVLDAGEEFTAQSVLLIVLTFASVATAAIGAYEATAAAVSMTATKSEDAG